MRFICWFIGHNKILEVIREDGYPTYFDYCTQCHKSWFNENLSGLPKISEPKIQKEPIKVFVKPKISKRKISKEPMKVIVKPNLQKIRQKRMLLQKARANFYVL